MKLIFLFSSIIIAVNGNLVDNLRNANVSIADIELCTNWYSYLNVNDRLTQSKCCDWLNFIEYVRNVHSEPCRPLLTKYIQQLENVTKITCESGHFQFGCPYLGVNIVSILFVFLISVTSALVLQHRIQTPDDLGGWPLTNMFGMVLNLSAILHSTLCVAFVYYYYFWNRQ